MELAELSKLVDEFANVRETRLAMDREAKALKSAETKLKEQIIGVMHDQDAGFAASRKIKVTLQIKNKPQVEDWGLFYAYMVENDAMDLLQKRVGEKAVQARFDDNEPVPGVVFYEKNDLSVSKL